MPAEQPFLRQGFLVFLGGVEHHLDNAVNMAVGGRQCPDIESESAGEGRAYLIDVEDFAFDLARFQDVLGQGDQDRLFAQAEAQSLPSGRSADPGGDAPPQAGWPALPDPSGTWANRLFRGCTTIFSACFADIIAVVLPHGQSFSPPNMRRLRP